MNPNSNKNKSSEDLSNVEESASVYISKTDLEKEHLDSMPEILKQLLEKGIKQCEKGEFIPHEKVISDIKKRFNLS